MRSTRFMACLRLMAAVGFWLLAPRCSAQADGEGVAPAAPSASDTIQLKNGTQIVGEVIAIREGEIRFDPTDFGDVIIKVRHLAQIVTHRSLFRILLAGGRQYIGQLERTDTPGYARLIWAGGTELVPIESIYRLGNVMNPLAKNIDGTVGVGASYTKSSAVTRLNVTSQLNYTAPRWYVEQSTNAIYTITPANQGVERALVDLIGSWVFAPKWVNEYRVQYQRQLETGVRARYLGAVGLGRELIQGRHTHLKVVAGLSAQREQGTDGRTSPLQVEVPLSVQLTLFRLVVPDLRIATTANGYKSLAQPGRYRIDYTLTILYEVVSNLFINQQLFFNYDRRPPALDASNTDFGAVFSVSYRF